MQTATRQSISEVEKASQPQNVERPDGPQQLTGGPSGIVPQPQPKPRASNVAMAWSATADIPPSARRLSVYLSKMVRYATAADRDRKVAKGKIFCYPMQATMAADLGCGVRHIQTAFRHLRDAGGWESRQRVRPYGASYVFVGSQIVSQIGPVIVSHREPRTNHVGTKSEFQASGRVPPTYVRTPPVTKASPLKGSPAPSPCPLTVLATPDQIQPHIEAMRQIAQRTTSPTEPAQLSSFNLDTDLEARFVEQDRLLHEREAQIHRPPPTPTATGCPECGHDRIIGGSCDQCGYDDGTGFQPSADYNNGH